MLSYCSAWAHRFTQADWGKLATVFLDCYALGSLLFRQMYFIFRLTKLPFFPHCLLVLLVFVLFFF